MLPQDFNVNSLHKLRVNIEQISAKESAVVAACCAEQMLSNYEKFCSEFKWGDPARLRYLLDLCWKYLDDNKYSFSFEEAISSCEQLIPDTEEFSGYSVAFALDAGLSVLYTLTCLMENDARYGSLALGAFFDTNILRFEIIGLARKLSEEDVDAFIVERMRPIASYYDELINNVLNNNYSIKDIRRNCTERGEC